MTRNRWIVAAVIGFLSICALPLTAISAYFAGRMAVPERVLVSPFETNSGVQTEAGNSNGESNEVENSAQYGIFPVNGGFGINGVYTGEAIPQNIKFFANGREIQPYTTDCRPFQDTPFYEAEKATRCDYIFAYVSGDISVSLPGYTPQQHGITLVQGAYSTGDTSWHLP